MERLIKIGGKKECEEREITFSCAGFASVNWDTQDNDFEFVFGEKVCPVHSFLAEFLSPKISRLRKCDPCRYSYILNNDCGKLFNTFESIVSSLRAGRVFRVDKSNFYDILRIFHELDNQEIISSLFETERTEPLDLDEALPLLRFGIDIGSSSSGQFAAAREFVASNFHKIPQETLNKIDLETAQLVLSSPSLQIEDEDSLYDFISNRTKTDLRFASLFEFVFFEYLSEHRLQHFVSFASRHLLGSITSGIWERLCQRLVLTVQPGDEDPRVTNSRGKLFACHSPSAFDGIIAYLTKNCGGNVHDKGAVEITASSVWDNTSTFHPKNAADLGTGSFFCSKNEPNSWICYDFKKLRVTPKRYSVRTHSGSGFPRSWKVEGSEDGNTWITLDYRPDSDDLNGNLRAQTFNIFYTKEAYRFLRFRQLSRNWNDNDHLIIESLEFFGILEGDTTSE